MKLHPSEVKEAICRGLGKDPATTAVYLDDCYQAEIVDLVPGPRAEWREGYRAGRKDERAYVVGELRKISGPPHPDGVVKMVLDTIASTIEDLVGEGK